MDLGRKYNFVKEKTFSKTVLRIQTLLIRILILLVIFIWIRILLFNLIRIQIQLFDPDPYQFKEVMYLKRYFFLYILTWFSLSLGPIGPNRKAYIVKFSLPVNVIVLIRVAYGSGSQNNLIRIPDPNPGKLYKSLRIRNTDPKVGKQSLISDSTYNFTLWPKFKQTMLIWTVLVFLI